MLMKVLERRRDKSLLYKNCEEIFYYRCGWLCRLDWAKNVLLFHFKYMYLSEFSVGLISLWFKESLSANLAYLVNTEDPLKTRVYIPKDFAVKKSLPV